MQGNKEAGFDMKKNNEINFDRQESSVVSFDMSRCKVGDKLITRNGDVVELGVQHPSLRYYKYRVKGVGNTGWSVDDHGFYLRDQTCALDIIGFANFAEACDEQETNPETKMILTTDSAARKQMPITTGVLDYFPLAIAEVAKCSKAGNDQHHKGKPLHWDKSKSTDHADCIARHLIDRGSYDTDGIRHSVKLAWRALAYLQIQLENEQKGNSCET